jgi:hypothetical protein
MRKAKDANLTPGRPFRTSHLVSDAEYHRI